MFILSQTFTSSSRAVIAGLLLAAVLPAASARAAGHAELTSALPTAAKLETDNYLVDIAATGSYQAGVAGSVSVTLTTKGVFHINALYPYRFKTTTPADGVSYPKPVLERADGEFAEKTAVFNLPFVAGRPGTFELGGVFNLSVCSPNSCLMQKVPLTLSVAVQ